MRKSYFARIDVTNYTYEGKEKVGSAIAEVVEYEGDAENAPFKKFYIIGDVKRNKKFDYLYGKEFDVGGLVIAEENSDMGYKVKEKVLSREEELSLGIDKMKAEYDMVRTLSEVKVQTYHTKWSESGEYQGIEKAHLYTKEDGVPTSVDAAEKWVLENHPEEYPGVNIWQCCPAGDRLHNDFGFNSREEEGRDIAEAEQKEFIKEAMEKFGVEPKEPEETEETFTADDIMMDDER